MGSILCLGMLILMSQCTFWCSVLSDLVSETMASMTNGASQCTFWCSVLSDDTARRHGAARIGSQCTFWCSVLSDRRTRRFRRRRFLSLNAPSGAQCFPTAEIEETEIFADEGLNAPSGAQCFPTRVRQRRFEGRRVSMHLLVLSAFRLRPQKTAPQRRLPERNRRRPGKHHIESARTCPIKPHNREKPPQNDPAPPTPPTRWYATDFQRTQAKKPTPHNYARVNFVLLGV